MITKVYISPFDNIYQNLCLEDFFLRESKEEFILFYVNTPCVVMGNFQNPWKETSLKFLAENEIALARRQSGGGTVYHDEGNLNFCLFRNKGILSEEDKHEHLNLIRDFLGKQGVETEKLPKSGMVFIDDGKKYKFSGEAFKQILNRSYHHGTILIQTDLKKLESCLISDIGEIETKAVESNPHLVGNISDVWKGIGVEEFIKSFNDYHKLVPLEADFSSLHRHVIEKAFEFASRERVLGKTPDFDLCQNGKRLTVKRGQVIAEDGVEVDPRDFSA